MRRSATADEWAWLTAPVTRLRDDGTIECYAIDVECWIESERARPATPPPSVQAPALREWVPTKFDPDGTPVFGLG